MTKKTYNPWPIGKVPKELQRPEIAFLETLGYELDDPREAIDIFEQKIASFTGAKYAVLTDCCTHAIELSLRYLMSIKEITEWETITIPERTYVSAALVLKKLNLHIEFEDIKWTGGYAFNPTRVIDSAIQWREDMYAGHNALQCISFQIKKRIPIGKGGVVITDDKKAAEWIKLASYDGRDLNTPYDSKDHIKLDQGYHYYMAPEDAARGIILMDAIKEQGETATWENYPNVKKMLKL